MGGKRQYTLGAIVSYIAILFDIAAGIIYTPWMIHTLGDDQYALYALAISVINIFLIDFGIGAAVTRFLSIFYAEKKYEEAEKFLGIVYVVYILISFVIAIVLIIFYFVIDKIYLKLTADELIVFKRLFLIVATYSVISFPFQPQSGILIANEKFAFLKACNLGQKILTVGLIIVFLIMGGDVYTFVVINAFSAFVFILVKFFIIRKSTNQKIYFGKPKYNMAKKIFDFSIWVCIIGIAQRFIFNIMPTIIGAMIGSVEITLFSIASIIEGYCYVFTDAINGMFMPKVSRIMNESEGKNAKLFNLITLVGRYQIFTLGLLYIGFICLGKQFIMLWMGPGYELVYYGVIAMVFSSLFSAPMQVANTGLLVKGIVKPQAFIKIITAFINVICAILLLPQIGIMGAFISVLIAYCFGSILNFYLCNKYLSLDIHKYIKEIYSRWVLLAGILYISGSVLNRFIWLGGWFELLIKIGMICFIYAVCAYFIFIKHDEKLVLRQKIRGLIYKDR